MALVVASALAPPSDAESPPTVPLSSARPEGLSEAEALMAAKGRGTTVEVTSLKSETSRVLATPKGTLVLESYSTPRWTKKDDGAGWQPIDTRLVRGGDGRVAPVATLTDVAFSTGGTVPAVRLPVGGGEFTLSWPGTLPEPRLEGDTAVYEAVLPDVDLRLRALVDGFTWVLVVKSAAAAANPALEELRFRLDAVGLTKRSHAGGGFDALDSAGKVVLSGGNAVMWDSSGLTPVAPSAKNKGLAALSQRERHDLVRTVPDRGRKAELATGVQGDDLIIRPDLSLLRGRKTVYPVVIDPWTTLEKSMWGYAGQTNATRDDGIARVGLDPAGSGVYRSFFRFNLKTLANKNIRSVKFLAELIHSWDCDSTPVNLWRSADLGTAGKQSWDGPNLELWLDERSGHAHKPGIGGCPNDPQPNVPMEFVNSKLTSDISSARGQDNYTLALSTRQSDGSSESTGNWWKKFDPAKTKLSVEYNTNPNAPTAAQMTTHADYTAPALACVSGASRPAVRGDLPYLKATLTDPDGTNGGSLSGVFTLQKLVNSTWTPVTGWPRTDSGVAPGAKAEVRLQAKAVSGEVYRWQVQTKDTLGGVSVLSPFCEFVIDMVGPRKQPMVVTADQMYPESPPLGTNQEAKGSPGYSGRFTFSANGQPDVYDYTYQVGDGPLLTAKPTTLGGSVTVWVTPMTDGDNTLTVISRDSSGNQSDPYNYDFAVSFLSLPKAVWAMNETGGPLVTTPAGGPDITLTTPSRYSIQRSDSWYRGTRNGTPETAIDFNISGGWGATSTGVPIDSSRSFSVAAWVRVDATDTFASAVAAGGTHNGAWQLQRDKGGKWYFHTFSADSLTHTRTSVASSQNAAVGVWQHVAGVYDAGLKEIRIYVDGTFQARQPLSSLWNATGIMQIGRVRYNDTEQNYLQGAIDDVRLWDRTLNVERDLLPLVKPVSVGHWYLDDNDGEAPVQASDGSGFGRPLTLTDAPSATICENDMDYSAALCLDGANGTATTDQAVLNTNGSWTVAALVKPSAFTTYHTVLSQCGTWRCAFYLQRQNNSPASWAIVVPDNDMPDPYVSYTTVKWSGIPALNTWVHLAATYDAVTRTLKLFVNGQPAGSKAGIPSTIPTWGGLRVGSSDSGDNFNGAVDAVQVIQGALPDDAVTALMSEVYGV
ncbi:LamG domain-containing protein [Micromonospora sp. NPDC047548]|uniref:LamG domain-containing protein n=1 Tax=Micromonospora sp. NPDC047548 TaxID=3155624 RepID=UPI003407B583